VWVGEEEVPSGTWRRVCRAVGEAAGWCGARMGEARAASAHADGSRGRGGLSVGLYTLFFIFYILGTWLLSSARQPLPTGTPPLPALGTGHRLGTQNARLRADPYRSQITDILYSFSKRFSAGI